MIYSDNGQGFVPDAIKNKGQGLMNIYERTKILGGKAGLDSSPGLGVYWEIKIPLTVKKTISNLL